MPLHVLFLTSRSFILSIQTICGYIIINQYDTFVFKDATCGLAFLTGFKSLLDNNVFMVRPNIFMPRIWTTFTKHTHTCEKSAI